MSRGKKLILLLIVLVVAIAAYVGIRAYQKAHPEEPTNDGQEVESDSSYAGYGNILDFEEDDIESIRIVNALDDFTLVYTENNENENEEDFHWAIEGHEKWTLDHETVNNTVEIASSLFANRVADENAVANERNLADFGLAEPLSTITVTLKDGTVLTISVGNRTADGKYYYGMLEGDNAIYTLGRNAGNTAEFTALGLRYISSLDIYKENSSLYYLLIENDTGRNTEINYMGIYDSGDSMEYYNAGTRNLSYGGDFAYDKVLFVTGNIDDIFQAMPDTVLPEDQIEDGAADLDQYGLGEKPRHHLVLTYRTQLQENDLSDLEEAKKAGVDVGITDDDLVVDPEDGYTYIYTTNEYYFGDEYTKEDGTQMVYFRFAESNDVFGVPKSVVDQFDFEPYMYVQRVLYMNNIKNVKSMKVTIDGVAHDFEFKRGEVTVDDEGKEQQDVVYKIDGKLIDTDLFVDLYQALIGVMSDYEIYGEEPEYDESDSLQIDYEFLDGSTHSITYYRSDDFYYVTPVGKDCWFACAYTQFDLIDSLMEQCLGE